MCHAVYVLASFRLHSRYFHYIPFSLYDISIIHTLPQLKIKRCLNHQSLFTHQLPPIKRLPLPLPSCVLKSLNATQFVVASIIATLLMPALPMVVVATASRHRMSWLATRVQDTQSTAPAPDPLTTTITLTLAMAAAAPADATPTEVFVGDESSTFWTAWRFWRTTQFGNQTGNVERRWQGGSTSVLGGASTLP